MSLLITGGTVVSATGAGRDFDLRAAPVVRPAQQRPQLESAQVRGERSSLGVELRRNRRIRLHREKFIHLARALQALGELIEGLDPALQLLHPLDDTARVVLVSPEGGVRHLLFETTLLLAQARKVKDASGAPRVARSIHPANGRAQILPWGSRLRVCEEPSSRGGNGSSASA